MNENICDECGTVNDAHHSAQCIDRTKAAQIRPRFIAWYGGECPVDSKTRVEVVFRDLVVCNMEQRWIWTHSGETDDIIAYRVIEEQ